MSTVVPLLFLMLSWSAKDYLFTFIVSSFIYYSLHPIFISFVICFCNYLSFTYHFIISFIVFFVSNYSFPYLLLFLFDLNMVMNSRPGWNDE